MTYEILKASRFYLPKKTLAFCQNFMSETVIFNQLSKAVSRCPIHRTDWISTKYQLSTRNKFHFKCVRLRYFTSVNIWVNRVCTKLKNCKFIAQEIVINTQNKNKGLPDHHSNITPYCFPGRAPRMLCFRLSDRSVFLALAAEGNPKLYCHICKEGKWPTTELPHSKQQTAELWSSRRPAAKLEGKQNCLNDYGC